MMQARGINELLGYGNNRDVVSNVIACYDRWKEQPAEICKDIQNLTPEEKCEAVFGYLCEHVTYRLDEDGKQYIKSPARLLADGCGDCKSFTLFISSCLHCLHIPHIIRFVNFDGGNQFTHVYPIAIVNGQQIILDACEKDIDGYPLYNYARPFKKKKEFSYN